MAKLVLNTEGFEDNYFTGTRMLGIISQLKGYRFCWQVNAQLQYDFRLCADAEVQTRKKNRNYFFQVYQYYEPGIQMVHSIYENQFEGEYLVAELKHFDFLWLIKADIISEEEFSDLQQNLKTISGVQLVTELMLEKIKNKENLIL
ncbi:MAG: IPExxxVDY family protein [Bacteroidetes bacterium]|nr:IPExxxVDY family protein [Bacteroidota bacterium]